MKKRQLLLLFLFLVITTSSFAQKEENTATKIHFGYGLFVNYNLYSWYQKPAYDKDGRIPNKNTSAGQVLNILPGLGANLWLGDIDNWILSIEAAVEYLPFALNLNNYQGMGAISIPTMAKVQFPIAKQQSLWLMAHVGLGVQFFETDLYDKIRPNTPFGFAFHKSIIGEIGIHVSAVAYKRQHIREIEFFVRAGGLPDGFVTFNTGLRLTFWNKIL